MADILITVTEETAAGGYASAAAASPAEAESAKLAAQQAKTGAEEAENAAEEAQTAADQAKIAAEEAAATATTEAGKATTAAGQAEAAKNTAVAAQIAASASSDDAQTAQEAAEAAATTAGAENAAAQTAAGFAIAAKNTAVEAAEAASISANTAEGHKTAAANSETAAAGSANLATTKANLATSKAAEAAASAADAANSASSANSNAQAATTKAAEASFSAGAAAASELAAQQAQTAAETAKALAEAAKVAAQTAQAGAEQAESGAQTAQAAAELAKTGAEAAANTVAQSVEQIAVNTQSIASLENVINSANINQETTATVTGVDTIALPKTAANTGMQVQLFGQSAQNLVVNGDFRNGTTGWTAGDSTNSVTNGILTNTGNGTATQPNVYSGIGNKIIGNKYYLRANVTTKSALCTRIRLASLEVAQEINSPIVNNPYMLSGVITASTTYNVVVVYHRYASTADANGAAIEVDNVMAINLTALGLDSLTKEQCDILFANYFEGSDNVLGTGRIRSVNSSGLLPSYLYFNGGQLRSNGLIKDEIRKGTNGYELVKRVGVGTLGAELITNAADREFSSDTGFWGRSASVTISGGTANYNTTGSGDELRKNSFLTTSKRYIVSFEIKNYVSGGIRILFGGVYSSTFSGNGIFVTSEIQILNSTFVFVSTGATVLSIDNVTIKEVLTNEGASTGSIVTVLGNNIHYTLATPTITPIAHAGLLNSNSNGTAYFEPIIADAGVYSSNLAIQLTDYPIASFESIRKYANGTYTELSTATAVIAGNGLSFTHPDLASGDLVMFTYAYNKESIGRSMTLTHYDSRFVEADTANGKVYRIVPVVTNGVVSWTAVEV